MTTIETDSQPHSQLASARIAIVGLGGHFPKAPSPQALWELVKNGVDAGSSVPDGRWAVPAESCVRPGVAIPDAVPHSWGCYADLPEIDPARLPFPAEVLYSLDPLVQYGLAAGLMAWDDVTSSKPTGDRIGLILGNIALPTQTASQLSRELLTPAFLEHVLPGDGLPANADASSTISTNGLNRYVTALPAGVVAQVLGIRGTVFTLDAACASSLYAIKLAIDELHSGRADLVFAGGISRPDCQYTQMGFAQLQALSKAGRCAPLSAAADGLVVGEGAGVFALKRLTDALRDGDQIYATIAGAGLSNDRGANLLAPKPEGQLRAMQAAYIAADWLPTDIDLIECHATGTPVGDRAEMESLLELWRTGPSRGRRCVLGSVKSNVGHLLTGAGAASLMKVVFALREKTLPPTANFTAPPALLTQAIAPFEVLARAQPWPAPESGQPRRAAINGFGFGGINAHLLVEEWFPDRSGGGSHVGLPYDRMPHGNVEGITTPKKRPDPFLGTRSRPLEIAIVAMAAHVGPWESADDLACTLLGGGHPKAATPATGDFIRDLPAGYFISDLKVPLGRFRIPPIELAEMLPQQALMLDVAAEALESAGLANADGEFQLGNRTGVFIGLGLDLNTTNFHVRWTLGELADGAIARAPTNGSAVSDDGHTDPASLGSRLRSAFGPALSANRTMGALGGVVASRLAREFGVGGPCHTLSNEESSGLAALGVAARALTQKEVDTALVGAIDFGSDPRMQAFASAGITPADGAVAFVLKRLADAEANGDNILAVITGAASTNFGCLDRFGLPVTACGAETATQSAASGLAAAATLALKEAGIRHTQVGLVTGDAIPAHIAPQSVRTRPHSLVGHCGAASALVSLVQAVGALSTRLLPAGETVGHALETFTEVGPLVPFPAQYWLADQRQLPRAALVTSCAIDGTAAAIALAEYAAAAHLVVDHAAHTRSSHDPQAIAVSRQTSLVPPPTRSLQSAPLDPLGLITQKIVRLEGTSAADLRARLDEFDLTLAQPQTRLASTFGSGPFRLVFVVTPAQTLADLVPLARLWLTDYANQPTSTAALPSFPRNHIFYTPTPGALGADGEFDRRRLAFVFPGSGSHFPGMGRELGRLAAPVLDQQQAENSELLSQYQPNLFWRHHAPPRVSENHKATIFGQVACGTLVCDFLERLGIRPGKSLGYSLGESAALFGLRAWVDRDAMLYRMEASELFGSDLVAPYESARKAWGLPAGVRVDWASVAIDQPAHAVWALLPQYPRVYLLIVNTDRQCVIGGDAGQVQQLVKQLGEQFGARAVSLPYPSTVHCAAVKPMQQAYRELHLLPTTAVRGVEFFSTATSEPYVLSRERAAEAIVAQALHTIDFPAVVQKAYSAGARVFVEIGPGAACTRMVSEILGDRPHRALPILPATSEPIDQIVAVLAALDSEGVPVDWSQFDGPSREFSAIAATDHTAFDKPTITIPVAFHWGTTNTTAIPPQFSTDEAAQLWAAFRRTDLNIHPGGWGRSAAEPPVTSAPATADLESVPADKVAPDAPPLKMAPQDVLLPNSLSFNSMALAPDVANQATEHQDRMQPLTQLTEPSLESDPAWGPLPSTQLGRLLATRTATHAAFLKLAAQIQDAATKEAVRYQSLLQQLSDVATIAPTEAPVAAEPWTIVETPHALEQTAAVAAPTEPPIPIDPPRSLSKSQCMEFAIGSIGKVLGEKFAAIDQFPSRVRLPDTPLMLVDRITLIEGEPLSMSSGRVVTEHDVFEDDWYLDGNRLPVSLTVESGQADLFLAGFLGIDFQTRGDAVYRLLDAVVTFHRGLPQPGETIQYDIKINRFFRQGETYLFRFEFEGTINGQPLLSMRDGCAGFFSAAELAGGKGVVHTALDKQPQPGKVPPGWEEPVPLAAESYSDQQIQALRGGNLAACFGPAFASVPLRVPVTLPGGRLKLLDRVLEIEPGGGKYGLGRIRAEADIHPDDWFLTCHFCDDHVMPGTLMFECCLHTLRVYLLRMGWIGGTGTFAYEPVVGVRSKLKCRGQVIETTRKVWYEITLKELGYGPAPYCIADALMYADGKPIVEITDMSVQMTGLSKADIDRLWARRGNQVTAAPPAAPKVEYDRRPALYDTSRITAFAIGKPSEAFGARYEIFDSQRKIARLPGPPFQFLDRITAVSGEPWKMQAGGSVTAQYDIPIEAWYFAANRQPEMPFSVLLETALQPCGWLAAYVGSALTSNEDLSFRNLGGKAVQHLAVTATSGTLTTDVKMTQASMSGGMIIQHYAFDLKCDGQSVYSGTTYFGFFSKASLAQQVGIRDAKRYRPSAAEIAGVQPFAYPQAAPFPADQYRMVETITELVPSGGPNGLGYIRGTIPVNPGAWFFQAHFFEDPVWPGSLGLESFLQILKVYAVSRWGSGASTLQAVQVAIPHEWIYRGQVIPGDQLVTVDATISAVDDSTQTLVANGFLSVDGRVIYEMKNFSLRAL